MMELIGLGAIKAAIKECWSVNNIPVTLDIFKAAEKSTVCGTLETGTAEEVAKGN